MYNVILRCPNKYTLSKGGVNVKPKITVKVTEDTAIYDCDCSNLLAEFKEGEILTAELFEPTNEYFAKDSRGCEVYVGEINDNGELELATDAFTLVG
jgi:hypothetical protein